MSDWLDELFASECARCDPPPCPKCERMKAVIRARATKSATQRSGSTPQPSLSAKVPESGRNSAPANMPTPRCDAEELKIHGGMYSDGTDGVTAEEDCCSRFISLARTLERELTAQRERADRLQEEVKRLSPIGIYNGLNIEQWKECTERAEAERNAQRERADRLDRVYVALETIIKDQQAALAALKRDYADLQHLYGAVCVYLKELGATFVPLKLPVNARGDK